MKEFLPPIEREDITTLSQEIDDVTDSVEDALLFMSMFNMLAIKPEISNLLELIATRCKSIYKLD